MQVCVVDLETTGFNPRRDFLVEVGICRLDLATGEITSLVDSLVQEAGFAVRASPNALIFRHSNLRFRDILEAPPWPAVKPLVVDACGRYPVAAYNVNFDLGFLRARGIRPRRELPCIMRAAARACQIKTQTRTAKWPSLVEAWHAFFPDEPFVQLHRAYDDCIHEARLLWRMRYNGAYQIHK